MRVKIVLEKRLGVAQLCLLLAVLVFLSVTRVRRANSTYCAQIAAAQTSRATGADVA